MKLESAFSILIDEFETIETIAEGRVLLRRIADLYGLRHAVYFASRVPELTTREPYIATTYSEPWIRHYQEMGFVEIDPVLRAGLLQMLPTDWSTFDRSQPMVRRMFGEADEFGVGCQGMTFPIRGAHGEAAMFSITSDASDRDWKFLKAFYMRDFQTIANFVHEMVLRTEDVRPKCPKLSPRELECLKWAAAGKTYADIATILNINVSTVKTYMEFARAKLNTLNTTHSVARAMSARLINLSE
ncbi:LuxR family transcriptional regulator [Breoghania sp. L-A4]|uniref:LuxR family transcriptional regulator n=1 Tax=Breoghania sp. L-A4 TaxID=2304600 RepID=UPI000E35DDA2|nr:LuxR family transcriptional regulator [Breoghania sp. L-A4]AXS41405.1 LuxR family transcriptional regulator [Breoghania sp. L-A4]